MANRPKPLPRHAAWLIAPMLGCSSPPPAKPIAPPPAPDAAPVAVAPAVDASPPVVAEDRQGPCLFSEHALLAAGAAPLLCNSSWSECSAHELPSNDPDTGDAASCCMKLDVAAQKIEHVARPAPAVVAKLALRGATLCRGNACLPIGKKLAAAVARELATEYPHVEMTDDGKAVAVRDAAWNVAKDGPLPLRKPRYFQRTGGGMSRCSAVGDVIVVDWANCAGPCHHATLVTSAGVEVVTLPPGYPTFLAVSDKAFALATHEGDGGPSFRLYNARSGAPTGDIPVPFTGESEPRIVRLAGDAFAAVIWNWQTRIAHVSVVSVANPAKPTLVGEMSLPECK